MNDMSHVIVPKSDQINADDLISGPITITIEEIQIKGGQEQPVSIYFTGSEKAFRPCKSMSRVLVAAWGADANKYVGRSLTLYRDPKVKWGGMEVGGIRISHMSHIDRDMVMALTATKGRRDPFKVRPLADAPAPTSEPAKQDRAKEGTLALMRRIQAEGADVDAILAELDVSKQRTYLASKRPELAEMLDKAIAVARAQANDDPFADQPAAGASPSGAPEAPQSDEQAGSDLFREGRGNEDMGEQPAPIDRALLLVAVAASPTECSEICDDYISQLSDDEYARLSTAANERGRVLMAAEKVGK